MNQTELEVEVYHSIFNQNKKQVFTGPTGDDVSYLIQKIHLCADSRNPNSIISHFVTKSIHSQTAHVQPYGV